MRAACRQEHANCVIVIALLDLSRHNRKALMAKLSLNIEEGSVRAVRQCLALKLALVRGNWEYRSDQLEIRSMTRLCEGLDE